ncbi:MAG TPA: hypothetical protein VMR98_04170 [Candidatus Polarisedimenticolaceae bacterium]|nr:hypothetical protein [Candidatus Polarisedimenticolaceae bacterium]
MKSRSPLVKRLHAVVAAVFAVGAAKLLWAATIAYAGSLSSASLLLSDPRPSQSGVSYTFTFTVASGTVLKAFRAQICTTQSGGCVTPPGFSGAGATLGAQPSGFGDAGGWTSDPVAGSLQMVKTANTAPPSGSQQIIFNGVANPNAEATYYMRLTTYADAGYATDVDSGSAALVIVPGITISAAVDPTLNFAVAGIPPSTSYKGTLSTADRCADSAASITFGTSLMPLAADTNYDCGQTLTTGTNGSGGYQVTVHGGNSGNTMKNGTTSITDWAGTNGSPTATPVGSAALFAYTTNDPTLSGTSNRFTVSDNLFAGLNTTPAEVAYHSTAVANDTVNVAYRLKFTPLSPGGTYIGKVVYTCTATF